MRQRLRDGLDLLERPASNFHLAALVVLVASVLAIVEVVFLPARPFYAAALLPTLVATALGLTLLLAAPTLALERRLALAAQGVGLGLVPPGRPTVWAALLYGGGFVLVIAGYGWLAMTRLAVTRDDVIVQWGLLDKRMVVFGYLGLVALVVFHFAASRLFLAPRAPGLPAEAPRRTWAARLGGAVAIAVASYAWIGAAALADIVPGDPARLGRFYDYHTLVHLGALEQIRLGALPYLEAWTQYGLGNQLLTYGLTHAFAFSAHGFHAGVLLVDVVCLVAFFVFLQQMLGLGWAMAALVGWTLFPSPAQVLPLAGWAILTRWIGVAVLAVLLARLLLARRAGASATLAPLLAGVLWGAGGFLSQENLSGGLLVLVLSLAVHGPARGARLSSLVRFAGLFVVAGAATFFLLTTVTIGAGHTLAVLRQASAQSGLVMAGLSNSVWSENVGLSLGLEIIDGWAYGTVSGHGPLRPALLAYLGGLLLVLGVALAARPLGRRDEIDFDWKFAGVTIGAVVLQLFALLRSDESHLAGPGFLLPLFLLMLPCHAGRRLLPGPRRGLVLLVALVPIVDAVVDQAGPVARRVVALKDAGVNTVAALGVYRTLLAAGPPADMAARYTPVVRDQAAFRALPAMADMQDLAARLHAALKGRRVELVLPTPDDPMTDPELLYFFGGLRSVTGITSPRGSLWLKADEAAWVARILADPAACVFIDARSQRSALDKAWNEAVAKGMPVDSKTIAGARVYGTLSCRK